MSKQARIQCPKCGHPFTVRQRVSWDARLWAAADELFHEMDRIFRDFFKRMK